MQQTFLIQWLKLEPKAMLRNIRVDDINVGPLAKPSLEKEKFVALYYRRFISGVYPILEYPKVLIDVSSVPDLKRFYMDQNLVIGAGNTLTDLISIFATVGNTENFGYLNVLIDHLNLVAHVTVRNVSLFYFATI